MTTAEIYRLSNGEIKGFCISGHAGAKRKRDEYDMVCAAISAVAYTALGGLEELCGINTYKESDGNLDMELPKAVEADIWAKAQVILETMVIGLRQIEMTYPRHIQVRFKEV